MWVEREGTRRGTGHLFSRVLSSRQKPLSSFKVFHLSEGFELNIHNQARLKMI